MDIRPDTPPVKRKSPRPIKDEAIRVTGVKELRSALRALEKETDFKDLNKQIGEEVIRLAKKRAYSPVSRKFVRESLKSSKRVNGVRVTMGGKKRSFDNTVFGVEYGARRAGYSSPNVFGPWIGNRHTGNGIHEGKIIGSTLRAEREHIGELYLQEIENIFNRGYNTPT